MKKRFVHLSRIAVLLLFVATMGIGCGDDDEPTGVTIADLVGTWVATSVILSNNDLLPVDPFDLVQVGATVTLTIQSNGAFTFSAVNLPAPLSDVIITGTIEILSNTAARITTSDDPTDPADATYSLSADGNTVSLNVPSAELIDFDGSGMIDPFEEVDLAATLTKS